MKLQVTILILAIVLIFICQPLKGAVLTVPVESEENNSYQTANLVAINGAIAGSIDNTTDFYDYYTFTLPYDGQIAFEVVPSATLDAYLDLYDWNGMGFLRTSYQVGTGVMDTLVFENLKAGTYFIRVGGGGQGSYTLTNVFTPTLYFDGNDHEPNDRNTEAEVLPTGSIVTGHINYFGDGTTDFYDYYSITLPSDGKITFVIEPENSLDAYLDLYDWNGESYLRGSYQTGNGVNDSLIYENLMAGTYYLRIGAGGFGSYRLKNSFTPTLFPEGNDTEPNGMVAQSVYVAMNSAVTGHLNYWGNGALDFYDYYTFTLPTDGRIDFYLFPENSFDGYLDLYDWNGESYLRGSYQSGAGVNDTLSYENLKAGTYYIRVGGGGYGSYTLSNLFTPTALPDGNDAEPNDSYWQGISLETGNHETGHINYYGDGSTDYYDWYQFTLSSACHVTIRLLPEVTLDGYLELFNSESQYLGTSNTSGFGIEDSLYQENLAQGTYYIKVGGSGYGSYSIRVTAVQPSVSTPGTLLGKVKVYSGGQGDGVFIEGLPAAGDLKVEIFDLNGRMQFSRELKGEVSQPIRVIPGGIYVVRITSGHEMRILKIAHR